MKSYCHFDMEIFGPFWTVPAFKLTWKRLSLWPRNIRSPIAWLLAFEKAPVDCILCGARPCCTCCVLSTRLALPAHPLSVCPSQHFLGQWDGRKSPWTPAAFLVLQFCAPAALSEAQRPWSCLTLLVRAQGHLLRLPSLFLAFHHLLWPFPHILPLPFHFVLQCGLLKGTYPLVSHMRTSG